MIRAIVAALFILPVAWTASASALLCFFADRWDLYRFPFTVWFHVAPDWLHTWRVALWVVGSGAIPTMLTAVILYGVWFRLSARKRQPSLYGSTDFATPAEMTRGGLKIDREVF